MAKKYETEYKNYDPRLCSCPHDCERVEYKKEVTSYLVDHHSYCEIASQELKEMKYYNDGNQGKHFMDFVMDLAQLKPYEYTYDETRQLDMAKDHDLTSFKVRMSSECWC